MTLICIRAHDGSQSTVEQAECEAITSLHDLRRLVSHVLDIPEDLLILMHSDGWQIDSQSLPLLLDECRTGGFVRADSSGSSNEKLARVWAFNRDFLDADIEQLQHELGVDDEAFLDQQPLPGLGRGQSPTQLAAQHLANARSYHAISTDLLQAIANQRSGLGVALANLKRHYLGKKGGVEAFELFASPLLANFRELLEGYDACLVAVERVRVHPSIPPSASSRDRSLADFVVKDKLNAIKESSARLNADLQTRFLNLRSLLSAVARGSDELQQAFEATDDEDLQDASRDADDALTRVEDMVPTIGKIRDSEELSDAFAELAVIEADTRERIAYLVSRRQNTMNTLLATLQQIASLQSTLSTAPSLISQLNEDLRNPKNTDQFKHLSRLGALIPAYAATVIEIVRRRRYAALLAEHSHALANTLSKLSAAETKRRTIYRTETSGKLPWEVKGMEEQTSTAEIEVRGKAEAASLPDLSKTDIEDLIKTLEQLERTKPCEPVRETRSALERALTRLESLEADFARAAALSADDAGPLPSDLEQQLQGVRAKHAALEGELQAERDLSRMREAELAGSKIDLSSERKRAESLLSDLASVKRLADRELEAERRTSKRHRESQATLDSEVKRLKEQMASQREQTAAEAKKVADLQAALEASKMQIDEATKRSEEQSELIANLRDDLHEATKRADSADDQLASARAEIIAERQRADEALARLPSLQTTAETSAVELRDHKSRIADLETRRAGAANEAAEAQAALREADKARHSMRSDLETLKTDKQAALTQARNALKLAKSFHDFHLAAAKTLQAAPLIEENGKAAKSPALPAVALPSASLSVEWDSLDVSGLELRRQALDVGPGDSTELLNSAIAESINGKNATIRKWQKECKAYRDRAKAAATAAGDKIAFRHFVKGDLALFLPTRNSTAQIWAAFNFGFPHYFLSTNGAIAELIKTREYVIARINVINEHLVDPKEPDSNPFSLASGTKYWLLEAEPWTPTSRHRKSLSASAKTGKAVNGESPPSAAVRSVSAPLPAVMEQSDFSVINGEDAQDKPTVFRPPPTSSNLGRALAASVAVPQPSVPAAVPFPAPSATSPAVPLSSSPAFLPTGRGKLGSSTAASPGTSNSSRYGNLGKRTLSLARRPSGVPTSSSPPSKALSTTSTTFTFASAGSEETPEMVASPPSSQMAASDILKSFHKTVNELTTSSRRN